MVSTNDIKQSESHVEPSISELVQRFKQVYIDNLDFLSVLLSNVCLKFLSLSCTYNS